MEHAFNAAFFAQEVGPGDFFENSSLSILKNFQCYSKWMFYLKTLSIESDSELEKATLI